MDDEANRLARARLDEEWRVTDERRADLELTFRSLTESSVDANADDEHDPEGATIAFERAQLSALVDQASAHLEEIARALRRLDEGVYGVCERCGEPIPSGRLEARPVARTCVGCS
jgi:RNA polymerase-binding transcription factor DksA